MMNKIIFTSLGLVLAVSFALRAVPYASLPVQDIAKYDYHLAVLAIGVLSGIAVILRHRTRLILIAFAMIAYIIWDNPITIYQSLYYAKDKSVFLHQALGLLGIYKLNFELTVPIVFVLTLVVEFYAYISSNNSSNLTGAENAPSS